MHEELVRELRAAQHSEIGFVEHRHAGPHQIAVTTSALASTESKPSPPPRTPAEALEAIVEGNRRFMQNRSLTSNRTLARRVEIGTHGQNPFGIIATCSDSRCAPEVLFDCGLGDLFVIRIAGHIIDTISLGSIEYAVEHLGSLAIVVLGHEKCGAVAAAVGAFQKKFGGGHSDGGHHSPPSDSISASHIGELVDRLTPAVHLSVFNYVATGMRVEDIDTDDLVEASLRMNVVLTAKSLTDRSPMLAQRVRDGRLIIAGFRYDIDSPPDEDGDALDVIPLTPLD